MVALAAAALLLLAVRRQRLPVVILPLVGLALALLMFAVHGRALLGSICGWAGRSGVFRPVCRAVARRGRTCPHASEREALFRNLSSYLPQAVASDIAFASRPASSMPVAARSPCCTSICAIFRLTAKPSARRGGGLLHAFFTLVDRVVEQHHGIVEEYAGDDVMAIWQASPAQVAHAWPPPANHRRRHRPVARSATARVGTAGHRIGIETGGALVDPSGRRGAAPIPLSARPSPSPPACKRSPPNSPSPSSSARPRLPCCQRNPWSLSCLPSRSLNQSRNIFAFRPRAKAPNHEFRRDLYTLSPSREAGVGSPPGGYCRTISPPLQGRAGWAAPLAATAAPFSPSPSRGGPGRDGLLAA